MAKCTNKAQQKFKGDEDFPELSKHNNVMAKVLTKTPEIYTKYRDIATCNNFSFDKAIQTGVDNPGK